jgi:hypothetical protein
LTSEHFLPERFERIQFLPATDEDFRRTPVSRDWTVGNYAMDLNGSLDSLQATGTQGLTMERVGHEAPEGVGDDDLTWAGLCLQTCRQVGGFADRQRLRASGTSECPNDNAATVNADTHIKGMAHTGREILYSSL